MSQIFKRICDKCNKEIAENTVDAGHVSLYLNNSLGYGRSFEVDVCKDCNNKIIEALKTTLEDLFNASTNDINEMDTFFNMESNQNNFSAIEEEANIDSIEGDTE